jgi:PhnB protein
MGKPERARPIPEDYGSITPYVIVRGAAQFIEFLKKAFGAEERGRVPNEDGTLGHAEVRIGNRVLMMFDAKADWPDTPSFLTVYVEDCDAVHHRALQAGATEVTKLSDDPFGNRGSRIRDPFGNIWWIQTHMEDVDEAEMMKRMAQQEHIERMLDAAETLDRELKSRKPKAGAKPEAQ